MDVERERTWRRTGPVLAAIVAVVAVIATAAAVRAGADAEPATPTPTPTASPTTEVSADPDPARISVTDMPVAVGRDLYVGGEQVPGRWFSVAGRGTRWLAQRDDRTWWWGYDTETYVVEGEMPQGPRMSDNGVYLARILGGDDGPILVGSDTDEGGEGFGAVRLSGFGEDPAPYVAAVTDDGLVVARGTKAQWLWRPLIDGETVDLARTAPGQVVIGSTGAGVIVTEGDLLSDGRQGEPYLARISPEGVLTRIAAVPTHDFLEASEEWLAYVAPGAIGGETWSVFELVVQRLDGSGASVLTAPDRWRFAAPGFRWESSDRLLALVVTVDGQHEGLVRCRPDRATCVPVDVP